MAKQPWEVPDPPKVGDATNDITFKAVGAALSQWEYFEGLLSLTFSYLIGAGFKNLAAMRAYGSVETFRGRKNMIENAAEIYFMYAAADALKAELEDLLNVALNKLAVRRNEIAHGIVQPYFVADDPAQPWRTTQKGFALYPAIYAARKYIIPETPPLNEKTITPKYIYSSVAIDQFRGEFNKLADRSIDVLTLLASQEQARIHASMQR